MTRRVAQAGRLARVSLRDVPLRRRRSAAWALIDACSRAGDLAGALRVTRAVLAPSDRVFLVSEAAVVRELGRLPTGPPSHVTVRVGDAELEVPDGRR